MKQLKLNMGVSMNPNSSQIRSGILQKGLKTYNKDRRLSFLPQTTLDDYLKIVHKTTLYKYMTRPFSVQEYYLSKANYNNNLKPRL